MYWGLGEGWKRNDSRIPHCRNEIDRAANADPGGGRTDGDEEVGEVREKPNGGAEAWSWSADEEGWEKKG